MLPQKVANKIKMIKLAVNELESIDVDTYDDFSLGELREDILSVLREYLNNREPHEYLSNY